MGMNGGAREAKAHPFFKNFDWESLRRKII